MLRPATPADTPAIVAVTNTHSRTVLGTDRALIDETRMLRLARYVTLGCVDARGGGRRRGRVAA